MAPARIRWTFFVLDITKNDSLNVIEFSRRAAACARGGRFGENSRVKRLNKRLQLREQSARAGSSGREAATRKNKRREAAAAEELSVQEEAAAEQLRAKEAAAV